jgi:multidrug efflux system membrane fusion protein
MSMSTTRRLSYAAGALALLLALAAAYRAGYIHLPGAAQTPAADDAASGRGGRHGADGPVTVSVAVARTTDFPVTLDAVGTVQALNTVTIRTQVDGRLEKLAVNEGQDVTLGDLVAQIDPSLYKALYDQAVAKKAQDEATLANARIDLVRYQKLVVGNFGSQQQYATQKALVAQLEAQVRADQASIDNTKTTLDYATIHSPINGRAGIRLVDVGNILHAADQTGIVVINQLKPIYVVYTIPQQALPAVQKAQANGQSQVSALGADNATALDTGQLSVIDNQIDQTTGTAKLKATFPNQTLALWPGQFVNVRMVVDTIKDATVAPSTAVQRGPNGAFVYVVKDDDTVSLRAVTTGRQDENLAVIATGLEPGTRVVTSGFSRLSDGAKIVIPEPPAGADKSKAETPAGERPRPRRKDGGGEPAK